MTDTNQNGAEGRKEEADFTPNRFRKTKHTKKRKNHKRNRKHKKREYVRLLDTTVNKVRLETDRAIKEAMDLMNNTDVRPMNLMQTTKIELPNLCKGRLQTGENIVIAQRAQNLTNCWCQASNSTDTSGISYLSLPYLNVQQFGDFFVCAGQSSGYKQTDGDKNGKFINLEDVKEYPEALFNAVIGKHISGTPINWLRFWIYLCSSGEEVDEAKWKANERTDPQKIGNETYLQIFDESMKKSVELAIKQELS